MVLRFKYHLGQKHNGQVGMEYYIQAEIYVLHID